MFGPKALAAAASAGPASSLVAASITFALTLAEPTLSCLAANLRTEGLTATAWAAVAFTAAASGTAVLTLAFSAFVFSAIAFSDAAFSAVTFSAAALSAVALSRAAWTDAALSRAARRLRSWRWSWLEVFLLQEGGGEVEGGGAEDVGFWN